MIDEEFESMDYANKFYSRYAKIMGFSVHKHHVKKDNNGDIRKQVWVCNKEGYKSHVWHEKKRYKKKAKGNNSSRCPALFGVIKNRSKGNWVETKFVHGHSHCLLHGNHIHCLRSI